MKVEIIYMSLLLANNEHNFNLFHDVAERISMAWGAD